jgi:hypothetical protein
MLKFICQKVAVKNLGNCPDVGLTRLTTFIPQNSIVAGAKAESVTSLLTLLSVLV